jgi:uncharacterized membrane protein YeaQ/YmgE (transglycosylase-associated protein family)
MFGLIGTLIIGGLAGYVGSIMFKGQGSGILINILLGIAGGFIGGFLFGLLGFQSTTVIGEFISAAIGAFVLLWIVQKIRS